MVRLCRETANVLYASFTPFEITYVQGTCPKLESVLAERIEILRAVSEFTRKLGEGAVQDLSKIRIGGTEEDLALKGSIYGFADSKQLERTRQTDGRNGPQA